MIRVLVVMRHQDRRRGVADILKLSGYKVLTAATWEGASKRVSKKVPDVIVSDIETYRQASLKLFHITYPRLHWIFLLLTFKNLSYRLPESEITVHIDEYLSKELLVEDWPVLISYALLKKQRNDRNVGTLKGVPHILVVEDDQYLLEGVREILELGGYEDVTLASNGAAGLQVAHDRTPDVIISDIMMPHMDGYEFFERLHYLYPNRTWMFIFLSAKTSDHDVRLGKVLGADAYIRKPFSAEELLVVVKEVIAVKQWRNSEE